MKKAIVVGGCGFIGSHVVKKLVENKIDVLILDNLTTGKLSYIKESKKLAKKNKTKFLFKKIDIITNKKIILDDMYDTMFHLAALPRVEPSIKEPWSHHVINVDGTLRMLELCRQNEINNFIFSSSSSVYGDPEKIPTQETDILNCMSPYALHKQIGEEYCKLYSDLYGINCVALRYFNVYGENQPNEGAYVPVIGIWFKQYDEGKPLTITGDGTQTRDFVYVGDVANANILAATIKNEKKFRVYNIGSNANYSLNNISEFISNSTIYIEKRHEPHTTLANINKIYKDLGWIPKTNLLRWITDKGYGNKKF